jgi:hypothetical protein
VQQQIGERPVLGKQAVYLFALDRDVAHRLRHHAVDEDGLPRHQVDLRQEAAGTLAGDLVPCAVEDRRLALEDGDEWVARVTDPEEVLALLRRALLAPRGEKLNVRRGEDGAERTFCHTSEVSPASPRAAGNPRPPG